MLKLGFSQEQHKLKACEKIIGRIHLDLRKRKQEEGQIAQQSNSYILLFVNVIRVVKLRWVGEADL
jgi:hypothetical protein